MVTQTLDSPPQALAAAGRRFPRAWAWVAALTQTRAAGLALLWLSFFVGCIPIFLGTFSDEGDKLAIAQFMLRGSLLYRDLFTHQFPFTYFWVAGSLLLLGSNVLAVRLGLLFFQLVVFTLLMRLTRAYAPMGLAALAWSAARPIYLGQLVLYTSLNSLLLAGIFGIVLADLLVERQPGRPVWLALGALAGMALLTDLASAPPVALVYAALLFTRDGWRRALWAGAATAVVLAAAAGYLLLSGTAGDFYRDVILFNAQVYSRYTGLTWKSYALPVLAAVPSGLGILHPADWVNPTAFSPYAAFGPLRQWLFGGFLDRLAFIATAVTLLAQRQWRGAAFVYLYGAALLVRGPEYVHNAPFALTSIVASGVFLARTWTIPERVRGWWARWTRAAVRTARPSWRLDVRQLVPMALASELIAWPILVGAALLVIHRGTYTYAYTFQPYEQLAAELRAESCGQAVALGYYPGDPTVYFFSGMKPVSKYVYMWPWVAEVAMPDLLASLDHGAAIVQFDAHMPVAWGYPTSVYLAKLQTYLSDHYVREGERYVSPALAASCPPAQR